MGRPVGGRPFFSRLLPHEKNLGLVGALLGWVSGEEGAEDPLSPPGLDGLDPSVSDERDDSD